MGRLGKVKEEQKIYSAYGLNVYAKQDTFVWTLENKEENCLVSIRISNDCGNDIINLPLEKKVILQELFDSTIDNFLYWIANEKPSVIKIEDMIFDSLCKSNYIFNFRIELLKAKHQKEKEIKQQTEEAESNRKNDAEKLKQYCAENELYYYKDSDKIIFLKALSDKAKSVLSQTQTEDNMQRMKWFVNFAKANSNSGDVIVVKEKDIL